MITIGAIKKAAKEYDLEVVQRLSLPNLAINKICNLESCTILVELSLPHNEIAAPPRMAQRKACFLHVAGACFL